MQAYIFDQLRQSAPWALRQLRTYFPLLALPPLLCAALAVAWILLAPTTWKAYQSLLVRDDLLGENFKPGRFSNLETQKNAQETILHIARKPEVIRGSLEAIGPQEPLPEGTGDWIDEQVIEGVKDAISIVAPNGAEFGKTDVVILSVKSSSRERACRLAEVLTGQIEANLRLVRQSQLRSMQAELELAVAQLELEHETIANKVKVIELAVGSDLPVLRGLLDRSGGGGDVQRALEQIRLERRAAENEVEVVRKQLQLLQAIESDPSQFAVSSNELLTLQPIFKKLREGLTDAELRLMTESGRYEQDHPAIVHAREVVKQTREQIRREAESVVQGLRLQLATAEEKYERLQASEQQYEGRLTRLGEQRVEYEILAREMEKRGESLGKAKTELAQIESLAQSADQISLITRIGEPQADIRPQGMSKKAMLLAALAGGLLLGGGLVGLFYRPDPSAPWLPARTSSPGSAPPVWAQRPPEKAAAQAAARESINRQTDEPPEVPVAHQPGEAGLVHAEAQTSGSVSNEGFVASSSNLSAWENSASAKRLASEPSPAIHPNEHSEPLEDEPLIRIPVAAAIEPASPGEQRGSSQPSSECESNNSAELPPPIGVPSVTPPGLALPSHILDLPPSASVPAEDLSESPSINSDRTAEVLSAYERQPGSSKSVDATPFSPDIVDLNKLRRELAEAAEQARIPAPPTRADEQTRGQAISPKRSAADASAGSEQAAETKQPSRQAALTDRIEFLSQSISTFCDAIQVEPPREGSV